MLSTRAQRLLVSVTRHCRPQALQALLLKETPCLSPAEPPTAWLEQPSMFTALPQTRWTTVSRAAFSAESTKASAGGNSPPHDAPGSAADEATAQQVAPEQGMPAEQPAEEDLELPEGVEGSDRPSLEALRAELDATKADYKVVAEQAEESRDKLMRTLAEMENVRSRSARQADTAQKYAIQKFVTQLLDVADNLERAAEAVPVHAYQAQADKPVSQEEAMRLLRSLVEGVQMTDRVLQQVFSQHGVERYRPEPGQDFDPNIHTALFAVPDPSMEPGSIGVVTKTGYKLHDRIMRAAEVGVVTKPEQAPQAAE